MGGGGAIGVRGDTPSHRHGHTPVFVWLSGVVVLVFGRGEVRRTITADDVFLIGVCRSPGGWFQLPTRLPGDLVGLY